MSRLPPKPDGSPVTPNDIRQLQRHADLARNTDGVSGPVEYIGAGGGTIRPYPALEVFEIPGTPWEPGDGAPSPPGSAPHEPDQWAKIDGCKPVYYYKSDHDYDANENTRTETLWHLVGYPPDERTAVLALLESDDVWPSKFSCGDYVWGFFNEQSGRWEILDSYEDIWRFELTATLTGCGSATAKIVLWDTQECGSSKSGDWTAFASVAFTVHDPAGLVATVYPSAAPIGTWGYCKRFGDSDQREVIAIGKGCPPSEPCTTDDFYVLTGCPTVVDGTLTIPLGLMHWDGTCWTLTEVTDCGSGSGSGSETIALCDLNCCDHPDTICVADAGTAEVDGTYTRDSPGLYFQDGGDFVLQEAPGANLGYCLWEIVVSSTYEYRTQGLKKTNGCCPPPNDASWNWGVVSGDPDPPDVTEGACP